MINYKEILKRHQIMKGERITLRPFASSDLHDLFEFTSDEEATRYLYPAHIQLKQAEHADKLLFATATGYLCN